MKAFKAYARLSPAERAECAARIERCGAAIVAEASEPRFRPHLSTWINDKGWQAEAATPTTAPVDWPARLAYLAKNREWPVGWGPRPGDPGCKCPAELLVKVAVA